jgi:hypothetical protein
VCEWINAMRDKVVSSHRVGSTVKRIRYGVRHLSRHVDGVLSELPSDPASGKTIQPDCLLSTPLVLLHSTKLHRTMVRSWHTTQARKMRQDWPLIFPPPCRTPALSTLILFNTLLYTQSFLDNHTGISYNKN